MNLEGGIHTRARGEHQKSTVFQRSLRPQGGIYERFSHVFLLSEGSACLFPDDDTRELNGPAAIFLPASPKFEISISAGSNSYLVGVSSDLLADALGNNAESVLLRIFTECPVIVTDLELRQLEEIRVLTVGFINELGYPERGSWMAIAAFFRLILMAVWRSSGGEITEQRGHGEVTSILQRFRQLVEVHFREHWPIGNYADELGITYDRLHSICDRTLGRSPLQLVHQRVIQEAKLRLERSGSTIQEISYRLGFSDPTYFSHFFKRNSEYSPAAYRRLARTQAGQQIEAFSFEFSDWP